MHGEGESRIWLAGERSRLASPSSPTPRTCPPVELHLVLSVPWKLSVGCEAGRASQTLSREGLDFRPGQNALLPQMQFSVGIARKVEWQDGAVPGSLTLGSCKPGCINDTAGHGHAFGKQRSLSPSGSFLIDRCRWVPPRSSGSTRLSPAPECRSPLAVLSRSPCCPLFTPHRSCGDPFSSPSTQSGLHWQLPTPKKVFLNKMTHGIIDASDHFCFLFGF